MRMIVNYQTAGPYIQRQPKHAYLPQAELQCKVTKL